MRTLSEAVTLEFSLPTMSRGDTHQVDFEQQIAAHAVCVWDLSKNTKPVQQETLENIHLSGYDLL